MENTKAVEAELTANFNVGFCCRICLQEKSDLYWIFDQLYAKEGVTIAQILTECTRYRVEFQDGLPQQICGVCMELAYQAYNFKIQTERNYRKLIAILGNDIDTKHTKEKCSQTERSAIYPCGKCGDKFFDKFELHDHRLKRHRNSPNDCSICGKSFMHIRNLRSHLALEHPGEGLTFDIQCPICQRQFTRKDHVTRHLRNVHKQDSKLNSTSQELRSAAERSFIKSEINYAARTTSNTKSTYHAVATVPTKSGDNEHTNTVDFRTTFYHLGIEPELHIKVEPSDDFEHETNKISSCFSGEYEIGKFKEDSDVDDFKDADKTDVVINYNDIDDVDTDNNLASGRTDNTTVNDFKSELEDENSLDIPESKKVKIVQEYLDNTKLAKRQAYHKNKINIVVRENNRCDVCQRTFSQHCHLRRHMLTHSNERPHVCTYCYKTFARSDNLKKHIITLHAQK